MSARYFGLALPRFPTPQWVFLWWKATPLRKDTPLFLLLFMCPLERKAAVDTLFLGFSLVTLRTRRYLLMPARK